jgi:hypothetical protein
MFAGVDQNHPKALIGQYFVHCDPIRLGRYAQIAATCRTFWGKRAHECRAPGEGIVAHPTRDRCTMEESDSSELWFALSRAFNLCPNGPRRAVSAASL